MRGKRAALHRGNEYSAKVQSRTKDILAEYERGALMGGLIMAVAFGLMFVHAAVML